VGAEPGPSRVMPPDSHSAGARRHLGRMPAVSVIRVQPVLATRHLGMTVGEARFSDGQVARFRVLCRKPIAVRMVTEHPLPAHEKAVEGPKNWSVSVRSCDHEG
jgi:hypothetical protein